MNFLCECRFLNRTFALDDLSKRSSGHQIKFKRAFQFLQLLLLQRAYRFSFVTCSESRRSLRQQRFEEDYQQQNNFEVFLGGSCNPTTWRHDHAIPYLKSRSLSYYNPQVANWTPDLVEIEHRAKELAPLLFFVIDDDTRALASIVEVSYLAACGRTIIVAMTPMSPKNETKFFRQKAVHDPIDDEQDYNNVCAARRTVRKLLLSLNVPVFNNINSALHVAAYVLETTKRNVSRDVAMHEEMNEGSDILTPLPSSPCENHHGPSSTVVFIRSFSNKKSFATPDEFYEAVDRSDINRSSPHSRGRKVLDSPDSINQAFSPVPICDKRQISCSTNETEDEGYGSLTSSNRTLSGSSSSLASDFLECPPDPARDSSSPRFERLRCTSFLRTWVSTWNSYMPFAASSTSVDPSITQSIFVLFTLPLRFLKTTVFSSKLAPPTNPAHEENSASSVNFSSAPSSPPPISRPAFDLYIAAGKKDESWLSSCVVPFIQKNNLTYTRRQPDSDDEQPDDLDNIDLRKQSAVLYYLINDHERLSDLAAELAFVIGERKHKIVVYLQSTIDSHSTEILSPCERRDIQRSRKYLEDLAMKEHIDMFQSREQSWEHVLAYLRDRDE